MIVNLAAKVASKSGRSWHHGRMSVKNGIHARDELGECALFRCLHRCLRCIATVSGWCAGGRGFEAVLIIFICKTCAF